MSFTLIGADNPDAAGSAACDRMICFLLIVPMCLAVSLTQSSCLGTVEPGSEQIRLQQVPGCKSGQLPEGSTSTDACFTYQFQEALDVYFCASANCCPDTNRFSIRSEIRGDSIVVTIADTAAHLCRCNCTYMLHAEFHGLTQDNYRFVCRREDYSSQLILYSATVHRN